MAFYDRHGHPSLPKEQWPGRPVQSPERAPLPWVSYGIIGLSALMFLFIDPIRSTEVPVPGHPGHTALIPFGSLYGPLVQKGQWWRVLTYAVEHGNWLHILLNMSVVWTLGTTLERIIGSARFFIVSLVTCLGAAALSLFFAFDRPMVGASGMILGWAGVMFPLATQQGRRSLGTWLLQVAVISLLPNVSWQGHLGGFLAGLPCGFALKGGAATFRRLAPFLVFGAALATLLAAHPERFLRH